MIACSEPRSDALMLVLGAETLEQHIVAMALT